MAARVELSFPYSAAPQPSLKEQKSRITTVVADDSETFLEVVSQILDLEEVIDLSAAVSDGVEAIDAVVRLRPVLVILDVYMPGLDGISAATLLSGMSPAPVVVLMSSEDSPRLREACRASRCFRFCTQDDLSARVARAGGTHHQNARRTMDAGKRMSTECAADVAHSEVKVSLEYQFFICKFV